MIDENRCRTILAQLLTYSKIRHRSHDDHVAMYELFGELGKAYYGESARLIKTQTGYLGDQAGMKAAVLLGGMQILVSFVKSNGGIQTYEDAAEVLNSIGTPEAIEGLRELSSSGSKKERGWAQTLLERRS